MTHQEIPSTGEQPTKPRFIERDGHLLVPHPRLYNALGASATALFGLTGGLTVKGARYLPAPYQAGIVAATHDKMVGVVAESEAARRHNIEMYNMAKIDFWNYPVIGHAIGGFFEAGGAFPVDREKDFYNQPEVMDMLDSIVEHNGVISMYPQGTRKNHERGQVSRRTLKPGVAFVALKYGLPITPGSSTDTFTFNHVVFRPQIHVKQVDFDHSLDFSIRKNKDVLRDFSREHIKPLMDELYSGLDEAQSEAHTSRNEAISEARLPKLVKRKLQIERKPIAKAA